jgi:hypothetical protein
MNIISFFSKILEKFTSGRLNSIVHKYNMLTDAQNGFKLGTSTKTSSHCFI